MKTILCAIDYSENSVTALRYALALTRAISSRLEVFHVYDQPTVFSANLKDQIKKLEDFVTGFLKEEYAAIPVHTSLMEHRSVTGGIIEKVRRVEADLLIAGRKGESKLKDLFMGHVAKELIREAPCAFLMIPEHRKYSGLETIVFATDLETQDAYAVLHLHCFFKTLKPAIHVVHITTLQNMTKQTQIASFRSELSRADSNDQIRFEILASNKIIPTLTDYLRESKADMVAMIARERGGFTHLLSEKDTVERMRHSSEIPLWAYNAWSSPIPGLNET